jgi:integrase
MRERDFTNNNFDPALMTSRQVAIALQRIDEFLAVHRRDALRRANAPPSAEILNELLAELHDLDRSDRHIVSLRSCLKLFVQKFPCLEAASDAEISKFLRELKVGARRRDNILSAIVQLSRFARRRGYLLEDRLSAAEKVRRIKPGSDVETWTPAEAKLLLEHTSDRWIPLMVLGLFAGLRTSEVFRLDFSAIRFEQRVIAISRKVARKIRIGRLAPMPDNLLAWLESYRNRIGPLYPGNQKTIENALGKERTRIRRATGLSRRDNAGRHSFGSYRLAILKNCAQVAYEMGNSPRQVLQSYNDPKCEGDAQAYFNLWPPSFENVVPLPLPLEFMGSCNSNKSA